MNSYRTMLLALLICLLAVPAVMMSQSAASVVWNLTTDLNPTTITGNLTATPICGTDTFKIRSYSGTPAGPLGVNNMRWWPTADSATGLSWGLETVENPRRYVQVTVSPAAGNSFTVDSASIWMLGGGTAGLRVNVYYSTDPTFATKTKLNPGDTAIYLLNSGSVTASVRFAFKVGTTVANGRTFYFRIYPWYTGAASASKYLYTQLAEIKGTTSSSTGVIEHSSSLPAQLEVSQNYPNPFNPSTMIQFSLKRSDNVSVKVYNMAGMEIASLLNGHVDAGVHQVRFDATNLTSGTYWCRVQSNNESVVRPMTLIK